jgi:maleylacetoacetate isomerase
VRIALNLKGLEAEQVFVHLGRNGGEQFSAAFKDVNPQSLVPVLETEGKALSQSLAIIEYLDEIHPEYPLLPQQSSERARCRQIALAIACEIHPLNNLRVLNYLVDELGVDEVRKQLWVRHWMESGLQAVEELIEAEASGVRFCVGDRPSIADCCLIPQLFNARRFDVDLAPFSKLREIERHCMSLDAFQRAAPSRQPDAA